MDRMHQLIEEINKHNYNYYVLDNPTISDFEYDKLMDELIALEKETGIILPDSPTQRVGDTILKGFNKYVHKVPMYSLEKCTTHGDLLHWLSGIQSKFKNVDFSLEYKFDGLSIVLEYNNGFLISGATRGNGIIGEDVTAQIRTVKNIPLSIPFKKHLIVAGECIMTKSSFNKFNKTAAEKLKSPRNAAAGALRNLDLKITASRNLSGIIYSLQYIEGREFKTLSEIRQFLIDNKFPCNEYFHIVKSFDEIVPELEYIDNVKDKLDILIDGAVIKINQVKLWDELGNTAKFPRWAIAYKFDPLELSTKLLGVVWQVGRTGKLTPIALLDPVELAGATVKRATLNNMDDIIKKNVSINSTVFVRRSNEVIPEITGVADVGKDAKQITAPTTCPSCGFTLQTVGANLFCQNHKHCKEQITDRLKHFTSRDAMNIEGLNEKTILQLNKIFSVSYPYELYNLTAEMLQQLEGFKEKKINNLLSGIEKSKQVDYANFIYSLGILLVGKKTAFVLSQKFADFDALKNATPESLTAIHDIGEIAANSITDYFADNENIENIDKLFLHGVKIIYPNKSKNNKNFLNKKIVLTGTLKNYGRAQLTKILQNLGADIVSSVSKNTDFVIVGADAGSKLDIAKKLGIRLVYESELDNLLKSR